MDYEGTPPHDILDTLLLKEVKPAAFSGEVEKEGVRNLLKYGHFSPRGVGGRKQTLNLQA
jgi:hypothetical protein